MNIKSCKEKWSSNIQRQTYQNYNFSVVTQLETMKARRSWSSVIQTLQDHRCQPRLIYSSQLSITIDRQNNIFHDRTRFNQYLPTNPTLCKVLEGKLQPKRLATSSKTQKINYLMVTNHKEGKNTHNNIFNNEN